MQDKVLIVSANEVVIYFTNRKPFSIHSSEGNAYEMYLWLQTPTAAPLILNEFITALKGEDTCIISIAA